MKKLILVFLMAVGLGACTEQEPDLYTGKQLEFGLFKSSDFEYNGTLTVNELRDGKLEFDIQLEGANSSTEYNFPAHLHFGGYDQADAPIAYLLNPVSSKDLESSTVLGELSDGSKLTFEQMKTFDGHVKIHLANEGPDYEVILVAGNVGGNFNPELGFDPSKIAVCGKGF
ncbi:hypothetical protein [Algoriphagus sp. A40]|uniref:hypothetical protein n=1 Tax=Algoriphagus sp. A40 TaxID=1945863 RepID=UPI000985FEED|nr:hypothetical protein [Algoriphagus sp. A40]OOG74937.1 hypothetical protein B0E43_11205 [Algoriphagus sp. A40]